jgi:hypothetical protein
VSSKSEKKFKMEKFHFEKCLTNAGNNFVDKNAVLVDVRDDNLAKDLRTMLMNEFRKFIQSDCVKCK